MTIHRQFRKAVLVCVGASLLALQVSAGALQVQAHKLAVVAFQHITPRHLSHRQVNAKRVVAALPVSEGLAPRPRIAGDLAPYRSPADLVHRAGICRARAPPLS